MKDILGKMLDQLVSLECEREKRVNLGRVKAELGRQKACEAQIYIVRSLILDCFGDKK